ncbi:unnamed protein product [Symbiodinium microadriaticum]|nr:unnamed protein product [Symbiodinium microadriaticum]
MAALSSEEFDRLQQELLFLKIKTEELREENARALRHFQTQSAQTGVDALRKAGAGAVSAIGQRAASLKSSLSDGASFQAFQAAKDSILHPEADAATTEAREEVHSLQERLKAAMEELASARNDAMTAQRAATACAEDPEDSGSKPQRSARQAEDGMTVLLFKVQQQQKELERVREAVDQQQAQIGRLTEKAAADKRPKGSPRLSDLEEQLRASEGKLDDLGRRLQSSQGSSRLTYELQCHLESVLSQVRKRDAAIESLLVRQERMENRSVLQRERLAFAQEDIMSKVMEYHLEELPQVLDATSPNFSPNLRQDVSEEQLDEDAGNCASNQSQQDAGVQVSNEDTADLQWEVSGLAASPTWSSRAEGDGSLVALEEELQGLRTAAEEAQRRKAEQAESLRAQIRQRQQQLALKEAAHTEARAGRLIKFDTRKAVESSGWLYVQKIEELEQQNDGLEQDLDLLASSKQCLLDDSKEKEEHQRKGLASKQSWPADIRACQELISFLMRTVRSDGSELENPALTSDKDISRKNVRRTCLLGTLGAGAKFLGLLRGSQRTQLEELQKVAEEAMMDNLRLRKDLRILAEEFRKYMQADHCRDPTSEKSTITAGSEVRLISSLSKAMRLCLGQGGWVPQMEATLGKACEEMEVLPSGNLRIQCGGSLRPYIYPPALIAEHLNAQTGPPLFVLDLHPHSLVRLDHGGHCAVCKRPFEGITEAEKENNAAADEDIVAEDAAPQDHAAMAAFLSGPAARGDKVCGFGCEAAEFFMCELCCRPYQLEPLRQHQDLDASGQALAVAEASLRLGAQCKLQHGPGKWLNAVVVETLPNSKVRVHVPMEEVPDQELEVTSPKLKPTRTEALELCRPACYPEGLHRVCFPHGLRGTLFGEPVHCSSDDCMPGGCRGGKSQESSRVVAYFCPRTAFLLCETCIQAPDLGQVTAETCQQDIQKLKDPESCAVAANRILGLCNRSQQARILFLDAGLCSAVATAVHAARGSFDLAQFSLPGSPGVQESSSGGQALLQLLTRLAQWLYLAAPLKRGKLGRLLVNVPVESRSQLDEDNSDAYSSAAHLYEFLTGRSRKPEPSEEEEEDDDWREADLVEDEQEEVQVKMLHGGIRLSVPKASQRKAHPFNTQLFFLMSWDRRALVAGPAGGNRVSAMILPPAAARGPAPPGLCLERKDEFDERLLAAADFEPGSLVLREEFLLRGPAKLPPLGMFRPVPAEVGTVEIQGEPGFPRAVIFDNEHMKLLFEFLNSEIEVQQEVLAMQDSMHPSSETMQSTNKVAEWLISQDLPWLEGLDTSSLSRLLRLFCVNSHPCKAAGSTSGLLKWGTMINHSCIPNVVYSSVEADGVFEGHFRACRPIKAGDVLGVSYMKLQVTLAPLVLRRRMLWYLKGFVCECDRCRYEATNGDPRSCGREPSASEVELEKELSHAVLGALCARWSGFAPARGALEDLQTQVAKLHTASFAVQGLRLLFLALQADEILSGKGEHDEQEWLCSLDGLVSTWAYGGQGQGRPSGFDVL